MFTGDPGRGFVGSPRTGLLAVGEDSELDAGARRGGTGLRETWEAVRLTVMAGTGGTSFLHAPCCKDGLGGTEDAADDVVIPVDVVEDENREDFLDMMLRATGGVVENFMVGLAASE